MLKMPMKPSVPIANLPRMVLRPTLQFTFSFHDNRRGPKQGHSGTIKKTLEATSLTIVAVSLIPLIFFLPKANFSAVLTAILMTLTRGVEVAWCRENVHGLRRKICAVHAYS
jgi:hypothetical protein